MLEKLIKQSPALANLFKMGERISNPFAPEGVSTTNQPFQGKRFPTYFRFKDRKYGQVLARDTFLNRRPRIVFETDAENSYFSRDVDPGQVDVELDQEGAWKSITSFSLNLSNGIGNLNCPLPYDAQVDDELRYRVCVNDPSRIDAFENQFLLRVRPSGLPPVKTSKPGTRQKPPSKEKGSEREEPSQLAMPPITPVRETEWHRHGFNKTTALKVKHAPTPISESTDTLTTTYDFFVNVDNQSLRAEQKRSKTSPDLLRARFTYSLVLIGLALLQHARANRVGLRQREDEATSDDETPSVEDQIEYVTSAVAPVLLPMLDLLSEQEEEEQAA